MSDKARGIFIIIMIAFFVILILSTTLWPKSAEQKAEDCKYSELDKWENDANALAHRTNDTATLKQIYADALSRGANPECSPAWTCDELGEIYHYALAKYEALKQ